MYCAVLSLLMLSGRTIAGTTDAPIEVTHLPTPREEDIRFILEEVKNYLSPELSGVCVCVCVWVCV